MLQGVEKEDSGHWWEVVLQIVRRPWLCGKDDLQYLLLKLESHLNFDGAVLWSVSSEPRILVAISYQQQPVTVGILLIYGCTKNWAVPYCRCKAALILQRKVTDKVKLNDLRLKSVKFSFEKTENKWSKPFIRTSVRPTCRIFSEEFRFWCLITCPHFYHLVIRNVLGFMWVSVEAARHPCFTHCAISNSHPYLHNGTTVAQSLATKRGNKMLKATSVNSSWISVESPGLITYSCFE